jgi:hypothetical protein
VGGIANMQAIAELERALSVRLLAPATAEWQQRTTGVALGKRTVAIFNDLRQKIQEIDFYPIRREARSVSERPSQMRPQSCRPGLTDYRANIGR